MRHCFFIGAAALLYELARPPIQLSCHLQRLLARAPQRNQRRRYLIQFQNRQLPLAGTISIFSTETRVVGLLFSPLLLDITGVSPNLPSTSSPLMSFPNAVY